MQEEKHNGMATSNPGVAMGLWFMRVVGSIFVGLEHHRHESTELVTYLYLDEMASVVGPGWKKSQVRSWI